MKSAVVVALISGSAPTASGYASYMLSDNHCLGGSDAKSLEVGNYIMGDSYPPSETSTDRTISLYRSGAEVADGLFMADDTLTVELSSTSNQYMFEIEGGTFTDTSSMTGCSSLRIRQTNNAEFVPDSGATSVVIKAAWASGTTTPVYINSVTLSLGTTAPSKAPSTSSPTAVADVGTIPTAAPSVAVTSSPTRAPSTSSPTSTEEMAHDDHEDHDHGDDHGEDEPYEWAGIFDVSADDTVQWVAQKVDGAYADDHMKFVVMATTSDSEDDLEDTEAYADALLESGTCTEVDVGDAAITPAAACYELHFDTSVDTSTYDIDVAGVDYIAIFTEHDPSEFEADTHYLLTAAGEDVEAAHTLPEDGHGHMDDHAGHEHGGGDDHHHDEDDDDDESGPPIMIIVVVAIVVLVLIAIGVVQMNKKKSEVAPS
eukprot:CAMPEP_0182577670 /NCGR_PEP_ID=MMETSP1324-20130603/38513_1 /TAXON_ID=236786 /ORGANISM="Florenciella sp., Strain RCC1587" /LENGTH=427 /DNA_ID=CAMNT_0024793525 /DNA_START=60 /DNA_END=1343 /DNA_ORIENTATION=+